MGLSNLNRFGEVIPMSRADISAGHVNIDIYDQLPEAEQQKCLSRNFIWKPENAVKAIAEGKDKYLSFWQNEVRKMFSLKPRDFYNSGLSKEEVGRIYVSAISEARDLNMASQRINYITIDGKEMLFENYARSHFLVNPSNTYSLSLEGKIVLAYYNVFRTEDIDHLKRCADRSEYGMDKSEKITQEFSKNVRSLKFYGEKNKSEIDYSLGKTVLNNSIYKLTNGNNSFVAVLPGTLRFLYPRKPVSCQIGKNIIVNISTGCIIDENVSDEDISNHMNTCLQAYKLIGTLSAKKTRKTKFPMELINVHQDGGYEVKKDEVSPENYLSIYKFKGGEFGNWVNESEREENLKMAYISFHNLADVLNLPLSQISFNGEMSIAFGSRGHGSALAHYEPGITDVINLTKLKGAGSLAHEWGHALDRHIYTLYGGNVGTLASEERSFFYTHRDDVLVKAFNSLILEIKGSHNFNEGSRMLDHTYSKQGSGYWASICEMFARAFDVYIHDKLVDAGIVDTYLSGHSESFFTEVDGEKYYAIPCGEEKEKINKKFDTLLAEYRKKVEN